MLVAAEGPSKILFSTRKIRMADFHAKGKSITNRVPDAIRSKTSPDY
jgi:hypothetical protein